MTETTNTTPRPPRVIHGSLADIVGRPITHALFWGVVFAAAGVDVVTFFQVLVLVLDVDEWMVWVAVVGFTAAALTLAHSAGLQARLVISPRNVTGSGPLAIGFGAVWFLLGATAFVVRFIIAQPTSADSSKFVVEGASQSTLADSVDTTSQHLAALLFLVLYIATGVVAALAAYFRPEPVARQYARAVERRSKAVRRHAITRGSLSQAQQTWESIQRERTRRVDAWAHAQEQCTAAGQRLKQEARLILAYNRAARANGGPPVLPAVQPPALEPAPRWTSPQQEPPLTPLPWQRTGPVPDPSLPAWRRIDTEEDPRGES